MTKQTHEIRDPVHTFIRMDDDERMIIDSSPVQRLRHIHQLATTYLVYPSATHRRFEHSLGVMDLASRVFDVVTDPNNIHPDVKSLLPEISREHRRPYWRRVIRMAALCHDLGHLPFSHAAEHDLLPDGWNHERLSVEIILGPEMRSLWDRMTPPLRPVDVAKLAVGKKYLRDETTWTTEQELLSAIITGNAFGVDRMDYLLRDSLHTGVAYGRFDHYRLIDTLRIVPSPQYGADAPELGVEEGGLHTAESLLLARYFMFSQMYYHPVRRIYDLHLKEFLVDWLAGGKFSTEIDRHLRLTDVEVTAAMAAAARDSHMKGHEGARRLMNREHFKLIWKRNAQDIARNTNAGVLIDAAVRAEYSADAVRRDFLNPDAAYTDFPYLLPDGRRTESAASISEVLQKIQPVAFDYVYVRPELRDQARRWLDQNIGQILDQQSTEEESDGADETTSAAPRPT